MNTSSLFLRSKGKSRDYTWLKADHTCGEPPQYAEILEILDGESPSIVILQSQRKKFFRLLLPCSKIADL